MSQAVVREYFQRDKLLYDVCHSAEVAVQGAAVQAGILSGSQNHLLESIICIEACPHCIRIGIGEQGERAEVLFPAGTAIPSRKTVR